MINIKEIINDFLKEITLNHYRITSKNNLIEKFDSFRIYNEFSLQHELGIFLRNKLHNYNVEFERNVSCFHIDNTIKKEIDIIVYNSDLTEKYAIELKFPRNKQYPEQMYSFITDIQFMEELKTSGFDKTFCLTIVDNPNFYNQKNKKDKDLYKYFRNSNISNNNIIPADLEIPKHKLITKPTGKDENKTNRKLINSYHINWKQLNNDIYYYFIEI